MVRRPCDIEVGALLGEGGMSRVHRAKHRTRDFELAVKFAKPSFESRVRREYESLHRFFKEGCDHDGFIALCPGIKLGFCSGPRDGQLCMELLEGRNCSSLGKSRDWKQALNILKRVAESLEQLHEAGWIHRDVKPANVVLTVQGKVKLVDFGLARPLGGGADTAERTEPGWGTPAYMAPEQIYQNPIALTPAVDCFALGGLFFHLLVGSAPPRNAIEGDFEFPNVESGAVDDESTSLLEDCKELVERCTRPRPRDRLTAREVADALKRMQAKFHDILHHALPALAAPTKTHPGAKGTMTSTSQFLRSRGASPAGRDGSLPRGLRRLPAEHEYLVSERDLRSLGRLELAAIPELHAIPWIRSSWIRPSSNGVAALCSELFLRRIVMDGSVAKESYFAPYTECELLAQSVAMFERPVTRSHRHVGCRTSVLAEAEASALAGKRAGRRALRFTFFVADVERSGNPEVPVAAIVLVQSEEKEEGRA